MTRVGLSRRVARRIRSATVTSPSPSADGGREYNATMFGRRSPWCNPSSVMYASTVTTRWCGAIASKHSARRNVVLPAL